ncbi:GNAT family N-acetyltransferase [Endozoicomonas sp. ALB032]|uniref:GNAT family N-acetyltransferase n=1 Tax=Endozoicomonas sp. ALB032 TaxID=3403082 RepID=UPI003BB7F90C
MSYKVELVPAVTEDKETVKGLFHYYIYEMSDFLNLSPSQSGKFEFPQGIIDSYWSSDDHFPFLVLCNGEIAGFSLLRRYPPDKSWFDIGQFFVLKKFKGQGVGRKAFELSVSKFPGRWITRVLTKNKKALAFWTSVIGKTTKNNFVLKREVDVDLEMDFFRYTITSS